MTSRTGHIGNTFSLVREEKPMPWKECSAMDERMPDGGTVQRVRHLSQDGLQDLRSLSCGIQGLADRSRRPHHYAHKLPFQVENYILNVKRYLASELYGL
jgi:hypothetical protein